MTQTLIHTCKEGVFTMLVEEALFCEGDSFWSLSISSELARDSALHQPKEEDFEGWPPTALFCMGALPLSQPLASGQEYHSQFEFEPEGSYCCAYFSYHCDDVQCWVKLLEVEPDRLRVQFRADAEDTNSYAGEQQRAKFEGEIVLERVNDPHQLWDPL